jgi:hypothetical protein
VVGSVVSGSDTLSCKKTVLGMEEHRKEWLWKITEGYNRKNI